jgi:hypothetical protein
MVSHRSVLPRSHRVIIPVIVCGVIAGALLLYHNHTVSERRDEELVKNLYLIMLAMEDFAVLTDGTYAADSTCTTPRGETIRDLCPGGEYPRSPFTGRPTVIRWNEDPKAPGEIGLNPVNSESYHLIPYFSTGIEPDWYFRRRCLATST